MMGKTLYICRPLVNADEFIAWAKGQGFATTLPAEDLHATIIYSKAEMDKWPELQDDQIVVRNVVDRDVVPLGDQGAVVLKFNSRQMANRWRELIELGAKSDYPSFTAHVTITWQAGDIDLGKVEPFNGTLVFGPEVAKEIDPDWKADLTEKFDPNQPREPKGSPVGGRWSDGGGGSIDAGRAEERGKNQYRRDIDTLTQAGYTVADTSGLNYEGPLREFVTLLHPHGLSGNQSTRVPEQGATITIGRFADGHLNYRVAQAPGKFWTQLPENMKSFTQLKEAMNYADQLHGLKKDDDMTQYTVTKVDDDLGVVFGWAIVSTVKGDPYFDVQGDYIPDGSMLKATTDFMEDGRVGKDMHAGDQVGVIVHSMPLTKEIAKAFGITCEKTGWMVGYKPFDRALLEKFRSGEYTGFSIGGDRVKDKWVD